MTVSLTYRASEHLEVSLRDTVIRTSLSIESNETDSSHRHVGQSRHSFVQRPPMLQTPTAASGPLASKGMAMGLGDVVVRGKGTAFSGT